MTTPRSGLTTIEPNGPCHACEEPAVVEWVATYVAKDGTFMESCLAVCEVHLGEMPRKALEEIVSLREELHDKCRLEAEQDAKLARLRADRDHWKRAYEELASQAFPGAVTEAPDDG